MLTWSEGVCQDGNAVSWPASSLVGMAPTESTEKPTLEGSNGAGTSDSKKM